MIDFALPHLAFTGDPVRGRMRVTPEDFQVEEIPAYLPSGSGEHLFIKFQKRGLATDQAITAIARALGVRDRDCGVAGKKDKHAVTTQWASFPKGDVDHAKSLTLEGITILDVSRHANKLRTGHLRGNRFTLVVREYDVARHDDVIATARAMEEQGCPNYYGEQRFGPNARNVERAYEWLANDGAEPRVHNDRKFLASALQSVAFNHVLASRIRDGLFATAIEGDVMRKEDSGGLFVGEDLEDARRRMATWEISPTGPMFGPEMKSPTGAALERERQSMEALNIPPAAFTKAKGLTDGTRRALRVRVTDFTLECSNDTLQLAFTLPPGSYATTVVRELLGETLAGA